MNANFSNLQVRQNPQIPRIAWPILHLTAETCKNLLRMSLRTSSKIDDL